MKINPSTREATLFLSEDMAKACSIIEKSCRTADKEVQIGQSDGYICLSKDDSGVIDANFFTREGKELEIVYMSATADEIRFTVYNSETKGFSHYMVNGEEIEAHLNEMEEELDR